MQKPTIMAIEQSTKNAVGWWFQTCCFPFHIWDVILPIDELIFFRGVGSTTNQAGFSCKIIELEAFFGEMVHCNL
jgi:hypothetical protein